MWKLRKVFGRVYETHLGWRLKYNEEVCELNRPNEVKNIEFN